MITIAFPYVSAITDMEPMYTALATGMIENIRQVMPGHPIMQISDSKTRPIKGVNNVLRVEINEPLMVWRLKAQQMAHSMADEILFVESDMRFSESVMELFDDDSDVVLATRDCAADWGDERLGVIAPYGLGSNASRSAEFWRQAKLHCQTLPMRKQHWIGDMMAVSAVAETNKFKVRIVDGAIYNHIPNSADDFGKSKAMHYKGKRKTWLFPQATEEMAA